jgi:hypothetical protein
LKRPTLDAIGLTEIKKFLQEEESDFAFELKTLRLLTSRGLVQVEHGGVYDDPISQKARQFDIRATMKSKAEKAQPNYVRLAIECKNIRSHSPVLVSCVPRKRQESYHSVAWLNNHAVGSPDPVARLGLIDGRASNHIVFDPHSIYKKGEPVGKAYSQISRAKTGTGGLTDDDARFFDRISQAMSSVAGVIRSMYWDGDDDKTSAFALATAIPIVVVPDGRLWMVNYADDGRQNGDPTQADRCPIYVDKRYLMGSGGGQVAFYVSHVELLTSTGLDRFISEYVASATTIEKLFPIEALLQRP